MRLWNRVEQYIKKNYVWWLEKIFARKQITPQEIQFKKIVRILVIRQHDMMGDFLVATPVFRALGERFPDAHIAVVTREYFAEIAEQNAFVDDVLIFYKDARKWRPKHIIMFWKKLRSHWDLTIVLNTVSHSLSSDLIAHFSNAKYVLGSEIKPFPGSSRNFFYNLIAPYAKEEKHQTQRNLDILRYIGIDTENYCENFTVDQFELEKAGYFLRDNGIQFDKPIIGFHIGAGKIANRWPVKNFVTLAHRLAKINRVQVLLFWGPAEEDLCDEFERFACFDYIKIKPTSLKKLSAFFKLCDALVCNDTGVMHLAASVNVALVAIFGPTDPNSWKPFGKKFVAIRGTENKAENVSTEEVEKQIMKLIYDSVKKDKAA